MNYSIIKKSQLEGARRLDAEYYQPEYLEFSKRLINLYGVPLGDLAFITDGQHGYHKVDPKSEIRHITAKNIASWLVNDDNADRLSKETNDRNKRSILQEGDLLLSTAGTIGPVGLVVKEVLPANIDQDVARIDINDKNYLNEYYALAFLNSQYGQFQIARQTTGQIQTHISLDKIKNLILIPIPEWQGKISEIVKLSLSKLSESARLYFEAENLLLEELGLKDFQTKDDLSFVVNLSDVQSAHRVDAEYFQTKYERLLQQIRSKNGKKLGDLVTMKKGFEPGSEAYQEEGKLFLRVSSISKFGIEDKDQKYLNNDLYQKLKGDFEPRAGEILLTKDATPGVAYVLKKSIEGIISGGILTLKIKQSTDSEYLALCISSIVGQMQAERDAGGSIIAHWRPEQIRDILIPILPQSTQLKIAYLVRQSHEARKKSKELLEEAKRKVEEMIEKGAQNGQN